MIAIGLDLEAISLELVMERSFERIPIVLCGTAGRNRVPPFTPEHSTVDADLLFVKLSERVRIRESQLSTAWRE